MVSSGLWDEAVPRPSPLCPEASQAQGFPSLPGNKPGHSPFPCPCNWLLLPALSPSLSRASSSISFVLQLPVPGGAARAGAARGPQRVPRFGSLCPAPGSVPSAAAAPLARAPPVSRERLSVEQRVRAGCSASGPVQFYCTGANRTEVGTIGGFLALPAPQREPWVSFFVGSFFLCVVFLPSQGRRFPPWSPAASLPSEGPAAPSLSQGFFCLWVCILVALSDFCFIICSNRLWCQKH